MSARNESDALACYREAARNLAPGLARAPWNERDDDGAAADAADAYEAQRRIDDGESDAAGDDRETVGCADCRHDHYPADIVGGRCQLCRQIAHLDAVLSTDAAPLPWERGWTTADAVIGGAS